MKIIPKTPRILDRHLDENEKAQIQQLAAKVDYNIMMGILEDPADEEEDEDDE